MRRVAVAWALAALLWMVAGAAAGWLPRGWLPDPGLLAAVALGLRVGGLRGLLAAWAIGWGCDVLSGSVMGTYALLHLLAWAATRAAQGQVALGRAPLLAAFAAALTALQGLLLVALGPAPALDWAWLRVLLPHVLANALAAPLASRAFDAAAARLDPSEMRPGLRFHPGAPLR